MKKLLISFFTVFLIGGYLTSCSNRAANIKNKIAPKELTDDQKDIVDLISDDKHQIFLYDFKTTELYRSVDFWVEIYVYGVFIGRPAGVTLICEEEKLFDSQMAVRITENQGFQWTFTVMDNGMKVSQTNSKQSFIVDDTFARGCKSLEGPMDIQNGKEIILYTSIFSNMGVALYGDQQRYIGLYADQQCYIGCPELIKDYPYVQFIKCRFSK